MPAKHHQSSSPPTPRAQARPTRAESPPAHDTVTADPGPPAPRRPAPAAGAADGIGRIPVLDVRPVVQGAMPGAAASRRAPQSPYTSS
ncbi:hypothetical protein ACWDRX_29665, partial [Streptomyces nigra]